jgi:phosphoribosyl 1,2-cyclic phosphate phosphodiesterase
VSDLLLPDGLTQRSPYEFRILGCGTSHGVPMIGCHCDVCESPDPRNKRTRSGAAIMTPQGNILIDTSPEMRIQLIREKIDLVHACLYTHSHADHIFGLDDLRLFGYYLNKPVMLYGEEIVELQIRRAFGYAFGDAQANIHPGSIPMLEIVRLELAPVEILGVLVQPIRLLHGRLPILGFRIFDLAFLTDVSEIPDESWPLLEGLDTLVIGALREKPHPTHMSVEQALQVVSRVCPRQTYFTHTSHSLEYHATNAMLPPDVRMAYDGLRIPLGGTTLN